MNETNKMMYIPWLCRSQAVYKISIQICVWASVFREPCDLVTMFFRTFLVEGYTVWINDVGPFRTYNDLCLTMIFSIHQSEMIDTRLRVISWSISSSHIISSLSFILTAISCRVVSIHVETNHGAVIFNLTIRWNNISCTSNWYMYSRIRIWHWDFYTIKSKTTNRRFCWIIISVLATCCHTCLWVYLLIYSIKEND